MSSKKKTGKSGTSASSGKDGLSTDERDLKAEKLSYYHYRIHRVDALPMLRRNGDFILRRMRHGGQEKYVVSVKWAEWKHFPVMRLGSRYCFEARAFKSLKDLIEFHINTGTPLTHASGARMERPKERQWWELLSSQIETKKQLGSGNFGTVYEATLTMSDGQKKVAAVKTLDKVTGSATSDAEVEKARVEMLEEARIMRDIGQHPNIVTPMGVTIDLEHPVAAMELVKGKDLAKLVKQGQPSLDMDTKLRLAAEAADGLAFIHRRGFVHRDVAARNCLVEMLDKTAVGMLKVTDFGMAKKMEEGEYRLKTEEEMPIKWSAPESLEHLTWTSKSDVWSFAILMYEMFTAADPYFDAMHLETGNRRLEMISYLKEGNRLDIPPEVPRVVADVMKKCWKMEPAERPGLFEAREVIKRGMKKK